MAGALRQALDEERPLSVVTVLESSVPGVERGDRMLVHPGGDTAGSLGDAPADRAAADLALEALGEGESTAKILPLPAGEIRAFIEVLEPPLRLLVCGAGHDAIPLVRSAAGLGWRVEVIDDREEFLTRERFPEASSFVHVERPGEAATAAGTDGRTHVVVMSHNFLRDRDYLRSFLGSPVAYIGSLGPRARLERLLAELRDDGVVPTGEDLEKLHGPAGLDIGGEGPDEIAWAIVSEILAVHRRRRGGFLRDRKGPIHPRPETAESAQ